MTSFQAAKFALAVGADIAPPERPAVAVNIGGDAQVGYIIDLSGGARPRPAGGPAIDAEAREVIDPDDERPAIEPRE